MSQEHHTIYIEGIQAYRHRIIEHWLDGNISTRTIKEMMGVDE